MFLTILLLFLLLLYLYIKKKQSYWKSKGVPYLEPKSILGEFDLKKSSCDQFQDIYERLKAQGAKYGGAYFVITPTFIPVDPEVIKDIMVKNFDHFMNHSNGVSKPSDPLSGHLFNLEDAPWKSMRAKLTPTFTSGKMKMMFSTFMDCTTHLKDVLNDYALSQQPVDIKDILARFTTDVIGSCAFGLECNSLKKEDSEFRIIGKKMFERDMRKARLILFRFLPKIVIELLGIKFIGPEIEKFFTDVVKDTVEYRETNNIFRKDFMHLLLQLKNQGKVTDDEKITRTETSDSPTGQFLTMNEITAQCFVFFAAGFETSSTTMSFALFEISRNKDIQDKLRRDIKTVLARHDNKMTYDSISEMNYLDMVVKETLRKYPPLPLIPRACTKDYKIPNTEIILPKDTRVQISVVGLHMDPEYYPDPEKFDPERFTEENKAKRPNFTWIPFGEGPRICIGLRFGLLQTKVGLATILNEYEVSLNPKTGTPLVMDPTTFVTSVLDGIWLNIKKIGN